MVLEATCIQNSNGRWDTKGPHVQNKKRSNSKSKGSASASSKAARSSKEILEPEYHVECWNSDSDVNQKNASG